MTNREVDELVSLKAFSKKLDIRKVHTCPSCGWETDNLEQSSRCQACWANNERVTMDDLEEIYDFHPTTDINDTMLALDKFFSYQIEKFPNGYGYDVRLWDEYGLSVTRCDHKLQMAICKAILDFDKRC